LPASDNSDKDGSVQNEVPFAQNKNLNLETKAKHTKTTEDDSANRNKLIDAHGQQNMSNPH
jgi:hypothetical protein